MSRVIIVSNRVAAGAEGKPAAGGLAIGVMDALKRTSGLWFGWSGQIADQPPEAPVVIERGGITFATIDLDARDYEEYYCGFSNTTLWPTFHYRIDLSHYDRQEFAGYQRVNREFARRLVPFLGQDDLLWVHDYHLLTFAEACRLADLRHRIGFFLHTPFPTRQVLMTIPCHQELMRALCCYDLVGFQTESDRAAFLDYLHWHGGAKVTMTEHGMAEIRAYGRQLKAGVYPIGVQPDEIARFAVSYEHRRHADKLKQALLGRKVIIAVDRLDYTKGLPERFRAFAQFLENSPAQRDRVTYVQIAPPTRTDVPGYQEIRRELEAEAGRINGRFADLNWTPLRYLNRGFARPALMSLFRAAQVGYVTPLRDGMNLVAKEYVAAQDPENPGVLLLSPFAGAAQELTAALIVNPYDVAGMAEALEAALSMPLDERCARNSEMLDQLKTHDIASWRNSFLGDLA